MATCGSCFGSGTVSCSACSGRGHISRLTASGDMDMSSCLVCGGRGRARCQFCNGTGQVGGPGGPQPRTPPDWPQIEPERPFRRSRTDKVVAGVLGGAADHFGMDPALARVLFVIAVLFTGVIPGIIAYAALAVVLPLQD